MHGIMVLISREALIKCSQFRGVSNEACGTGNSFSLQIRYSLLTVKTNVTIYTTTGLTTVQVSYK